MPDTAHPSVTDLHALVDWLDRHPELRVSASLVCVYAADRNLDLAEEAALCARSLADGAPVGGVVKEEGYSPEVLKIGRRFGHVDVCHLTARNVVCEQVVVGVEERPTVKLSADAQSEIDRLDERIGRIRDAHTVVETVDRVEWKCGSVLSAGQVAS